MRRHHLVGQPTQSAASRSGEPSVARGRLSQKTSRAPRASAASATTSIAAALISVRYVPARATSGRSRSARSAARSDSDPETATTSAPWSASSEARSAGCTAAGAVVKSATRSPATGSAGRGRKTVVTTGRSGRIYATAARTSSTSWREASGGSHMVTTSMSDTSIR